MYNEITVMIGAEAHRAFLQNGFYNTTPPSRIHKHNYTEIHVISGEASIFTVGENKYSVEDGSILMIAIRSKKRAVAIRRSRSTLKPKSPQYAV